MPRKVHSLKTPEDSSPEITNLPEPDLPQGNAFLKPADIGKGATVRIIGNFRESATEFSDYIIDVRVGRKEFAFGMKTTSGNYARLYERFGKNVKRWTGKTFRVVPAVHMGKRYCQVQ